MLIVTLYLISIHGHMKLVLDMFFLFQKDCEQINSVTARTQSIRLCEQSWCPRAYTCDLIINFKLVAMDFLKINSADADENSR